MSMEGEYKMRKVILKWLFGVEMVDMDTYSELLNKYGQSLDEHKDTLKMLEKMIDSYEENIQFMNALKEKINDLEERINEK